MSPIGPKLKNDGPACRVCGCTENNACVIGQGRRRTCSWVKLNAGDRLGQLCSACAGTEFDLMNAIEAAMEAPEKNARAFLKGAQTRFRRRIKKEFGIDWGPVGG